MDIVPAEKIFLIKDQGGTGKGLFMHALEAVFEVTPVDSDSLLYGSSIEKQNALMRFLGAEVAHLNETGRITSKQWPSLRRIGTGEV
nr:phage resistance protein [Enterococcus faecalis]